MYQKNNYVAIHIFNSLPQLKCNSIMVVQSNVQLIDLVNLGRAAKENKQKLYFMISHRFFFQHFGQWLVED